MHRQKIRRDFEKHLEFLNYIKGEQIYKEGNLGKFIYFIEKGSVRLYTMSSDGKEIITNILHAHNILGEEIFSGNNTLNESAKAIDPEVEISRIHIEDFRGFTQRYWKLNVAFIELITDKLSRTQDRVHGLIADDARKRIIDFLKYNAKHKGKKIGFELLIKHLLTYII